MTTHAAGELETRTRENDPLLSVRQTVNLSSRSWTDTADAGWLYCIVSGLDCERDHEHDVICGGFEAMHEMAARFGWSPRKVMRLRALRANWRALERDSAASAEQSSRVDRWLDADKGCGHVLYVQDLDDAQLRILQLQEQVAAESNAKTVLAAENLALLTRLAISEAERRG